METVVAYALVQAAGNAVNASINAYLNAPPRPSFQPDNGQETLFDEENWARVLDIQEILCLVRPFISAIQNLDIGPISQAANARPQDRGRRLDDTNQDAPPPYVEGVQPASHEAYLKEHSYRIIRTTQRLVETLTVAAGGPSASSGRAWNLNVTSSTELGLEVLGMYRTIKQTMSNSSPGSFLALVYAAMSLYDTDLLEKVESRFQPVQFCFLGSQDNASAYSLRLPATKRYLEVGPVDEPKEDTMWSKIGTAAQVAGTLYLKAYPLSYAAYRYFSPEQSSTPTFPRITKVGACEPGLSFIPIEKYALPATIQGYGAMDQVRFGSCVNIAIASPAGGQNLKASDGKGRPAAIRIIHCDDRYRSQSNSRVVCIRDRVILKEELTGKLLSRKRIGDDDWEVGFGISDDNLWTITLPM